MLSPTALEKPSNIPLLYPELDWPRQLTHLSSLPRSKFKYHFLTKMWTLSEHSFRFSNYMKHSPLPRTATLYSYI